VKLFSTYEVNYKPLRALGSLWREDARVRGEAYMYNSINLKKTGNDNAYFGHE
jgi:hypothetical protein